MLTSDDIKKTEVFVDTVLNGKRSGKSGFWEHVEEMLAFLYEVHPLEMIDLEHHAKNEKSNSLNKFHSNKAMSERTMGAMPPRLGLLIDKIYGDEVPYANKGLMWREFFRRFPQFSYAEKI